MAAHAAPFDALTAAGAAPLDALAPLTSAGAADMAPTAASWTPPPVAFPLDNVEQLGAVPDPLL